MTTSPPVLLLDACVLYPAGLRNLMMWLAVHDLIRPNRHVGSPGPETDSRAVGRSAGFALSGLVSLFSVRDPDGRHVLRATVPAAAEPAEQLVRLPVAPAQVGRLWQLEGWASTVSLSIGTDTADVPPYLATAPEQFSVPAGPGVRRNDD